jgi:hypothetical protein
MKRALIIISSVAVVLGIVAFFVVFYGGGTYVVNSPLPSDSTYSSSTAATASSTASSTLANISSSASSTDSGGLAEGSSTLAEYASDYGQSPMTWTEGGETMAITGATLSGSQLTLKLAIQMGAVAECVPMNVRLVADEKGDLTAPLTTQFAFPESGSCEGTPGAMYNDQEIVFTVDPATLPLVFTTGGTSNKFFELSTTPQGGISIAPPPTSG